LGLVRERQGRVADAELAYRKAISLNPRQAVALNNLAMILTVRKGDLDEALALAQRAVEISPNSAFLGALNRVYVARGEMPNAADAAARAAKAAEKPATRNSPT
jgi:Flp pilus assembly protein TadD